MSPVTEKRSGTETDWDRDRLGQPAFTGTSGNCVTEQTLGFDSRQHMGSITAKTVHYINMANVHIFWFYYKKL